MPEIDFLAVGQRDGVHPLQGGKFGVLFRYVGVELGIAATGGQLPHGGVIGAGTGVGKGQQNGVAVMLGSVFGGQVLQPAQFVQRGIIVLGRGARGGPEQQGQHNPQHPDQPGQSKRVGSRGQAPPCGCFRFVTFIVYHKPTWFVTKFL